VIRSFKCRATRDLFAGKPVPRFANIRTVAERKLAMVHRAACLDDLRIPPNNRLEALRGERKGQFSIRINQQYRLCFRWSEQGADEVEILDYH